MRKRLASDVHINMNCQCYKYRSTSLETTNDMSEQKLYLLVVNDI
jgi:hypothetical protein